MFSRDGEQIFVADMTGDGLADLIIAAPNATIDGTGCGMIYARSPRSGAEIWRQSGAPQHNLGWDLSLASDHDSDGFRDFFAGSPGHAGRAYLLSGKDATRLQTFVPPQE